MSKQSPLRTARVIGFFSLPSPDLAEHNPSAYSAAMMHAPHGAGTCSHCGTGIRNHVVIRDAEGQTRFIGTTCAEKVGLPADCIRYRMTTEEKEARDAKRKAAADFNARRDAAWSDLYDAYLVARFEIVGDVVKMLEDTGNEFYLSMAEQLRRRPLSQRQAMYAVKVTSATGRRNKKNAAAWDSVFDIMTDIPEEREPDAWQFRRDYKED